MIEAEFQIGDTVRVTCSGMTYLAEVVEHDSDGFAARSLDGERYCVPSMHDRLGEKRTWHWDWKLVREAKTEK